MWMRKLIADPDLRARIGAKAAQDMAAYQERARRADFIEELRALIEQRVALPHSAAERAKRLALLREQLHPEPSRNLLASAILTQKYRLKRLFGRYLLWRFNKWRSASSAGM